MSADGTEILDAVRTACDALIDAADAHDGLFPGVLTTNTAREPDRLPPLLPGQRDCDRVHRGANLLYDVSTLAALRALGEHEDRAYADAADRYLSTFATRCSYTATGLVPWGEHSWWSFETERPGNSYGFEDSRDLDPHRAEWAVHDHHRPIPGWLWDGLERADPGTIHRFVDGLDYHWRGDRRQAYNRHHVLQDRTRVEPTEDRACDFPVHGGYMIRDWARAYADLPRDGPRRHIERMLAFWEPHFDEHDVLPIESSGRNAERSPGMTIRYATGLLEAAEVLEGADRAPELVGRLGQTADRALDGFLGAPHDLETGAILALCRPVDLAAGTFEPATSDSGNVIEPLSLWGDLYGMPGDVAAIYGLEATAAARATGRADVRAFALAVGEAYARAGYPDGGHVPVQGVDPGADFDEDADVPVSAREPGMVIDLFLDLADLTGEDRWVDAAAELADPVLEIFFEETVPRRAHGAACYEAQRGCDALLGGLARLGLRLRDGVDVGPMDTIA